jgi:nuclease HARBI1
MSLRAINTLEQRRFFEQFLTAWEVIADDLEGYEEDLEEELEELQGMDLATDEVDDEMEDLMEDMEDADAMLEEIVAFGRSIYGGVSDGNINFNLPPLHIRDFANRPITCKREFRFEYEHLQSLSDLLWIKMQPYLNGGKESVRIHGGYSIPFETGFLILLFRMARPRVIVPQMEAFFSMRATKICNAVKTFLGGFHSLARLYLENPAIFQHRFPFYALLIYEKSQFAVSSVWGFIDGTLRRTCRPTHLQRQAYSGHKRCHGIKYQSVVSPDGLITCLYGPIAGSRHDCYLLAQSTLHAQMVACMPLGGPHHIYSLYGDPAYTSSAWLFSGFRFAAPGSLQAQWNTRMSSVREVVEWGFNLIRTNWSYLDFKAQMMIFGGRCGMYYIVGGFFCNLQCCLNGNQISEYFGCDASHRMTVEEYLDLV